ncbi:hypothetical protein KM043_008757 [Ampulex compressa]|nr:hypothetical protein KM043_008757 [Ampulex compressa]
MSRCANFDRSLASSSRGKTIRKTWKVIPINPEPSTVHYSLQRTPISGRNTLRYSRTNPGAYLEHAPTRPLVHIGAEKSGDVHRGGKYGGGGGGGVERRGVEGGGEEWRGEERRGEEGRGEQRRGGPYTG